MTESGTTDMQSPSGALHTVAPAHLRPTPDRSGTTTGR